MLKFLTRYISVGVLNTAIHWLCFLMLHGYFGISQAISNASAFAVAVTFSFYANARWTFKTKASIHRYVLFVAFMGAMATGTGYAADILDVTPMLTLVFFSAASLCIGFVYSKLIVFKDAK